MIKNWSMNGGYRLMVAMGEIGERGGVKRLLEKVEGEYEGGFKRLMVAVDNQGVLKCLRKGRGFCGELESGVRRVGKRLMEKG